MSKLRKNFILLFVLLNISILTVSIIYNILFEEKMLEVFKSGCTFLNLFGLYCPGCGGSRSLNYLLNFNIVKSFIYYPPIPITSLILLYTDITLFISIVRKTEKIKGLSYHIFLIIPVAIILNFVLRNILLLCGIDLLGNVLN